MDLFTPEEQEKAFEVISLSDGEILFMRNFFTPSEAKHYFDLLQNNISWKQEEVRFTYDQLVYGGISMRCFEIS